MSYALALRRLNLRIEWDGEVKPQAASAIRFLHLGRLLSDDETLSASTSLLRK
ncbi:hypothetical protein M408DRAFT_325378 [Serendipita vermifera MAFF 305830]|uniref:Uncharacterized protein n=1 Tax=Serendipita vermifera MAFF 305830 TaxID=933852 RepID=A0A0C3BNV1_SERVB|nr:hypothetical protein M408DRAFT_325378 [Serendipita vermifera MAFF 305830]